MITDPYGKVLEGNVAAASFLYVEPVTLPGRRLLNYIAGNSRQAFYAVLASLRGNEDAVTDIAVVMRPRKSEPLVETSLNALAARVGGRLVAIHWFLHPVA